jgi:hypothetical protein
MHGTPKATHRRRLAACAAAVAAAGCLTGAALAGSPYTVTVKVVPATTPIPGSFKVTASGLSANLSRLKVFLNTAKACAPTAAADAAIAGDVLVIAPASGVVHAYTRSKSFATVAGATGPRGEGRHEACAYLIAWPPSTLPRAHASASYAVG